MAKRVVTYHGFGSENFLAQRCGRNAVYWVKSRFGWDAVLLNSRRESINVVNYGLTHAPTQRDTDAAVLALCGTAEKPALYGRAARRAHRAGKR